MLEDAAWALKHAWQIGPTIVVLISVAPDSSTAVSRGSQSIGMKLLSCVTFLVDEILPWSSDAVKQVGEVVELRNCQSDPLHL